MWTFLPSNSSKTQKSRKVGLTDRPTNRQTDIVTHKEKQKQKEKWNKEAILFFALWKRRLRSRKGPFRKNLMTNPRSMKAIDFSNPFPNSFHTLTLAQPSSHLEHHTKVHYTSLHHIAATLIHDHNRNTTLRHMVPHHSLTRPRPHSEHQTETMEKLDFRHDTTTRYDHNYNHNDHGHDFSLER